MKTNRRIDSCAPQRANERKSCICLQCYPVYSTKRPMYTYDPPYLSFESRSHLRRPERTHSLLFCVFLAFNGFLLYNNVNVQTPCSAQPLQRTRSMLATAAHVYALFPKVSSRSAPKRVDSGRFGWKKRLPNTLRVVRRTTKERFPYCSRTSLAPERLHYCEKGFVLQRKAEDVLSVISLDSMFARWAWWDWTVEPSVRGTSQIAEEMA